MVEKFTGNPENHEESERKEREMERFTACLAEVARIAQLTPDQTDRAQEAMLKEQGRPWYEFDGDDTKIYKATLSPDGKKLTIIFDIYGMDVSHDVTL